MKRLHNISANADMSDNQVKFFYKHEFLGSCDPEYMECDKLYELIKSDSSAATQILHYMNSLGDPVFPTEDGGYEPETDVSKVDIDDLYYWFMRELEYQYQDDMSMGFGFLVDADFQPWDFEIFDGPVAEGVVTSTKINTSRYDNVPGYKAPNGGYLYIFKHGIGPGTMPSDVEIIKTKDLPNYYTAVWLNDFLTTDELKQYDIPDETRINSILDSIGYCQKNGDVVPCGGVEACGKVTASRRVSANKKYVKAFVTQDREDAWALIDQYMEREWGHVEYNEGASAILVMEMPFDGISEDGNSYSEGTCAAIINLIDFELRFTVYIPEAEGVAEEDWDHTIKYDSLADMVAKLIQPMADGEITEEKLYEMCEHYYY